MDTCAPKPTESYTKHPVCWKWILMTLDLDKSRDYHDTIDAIVPGDLIACSSETSAVKIVSAIHVEDNAWRWIFDPSIFTSIFKSLGPGVVVSSTPFIEWIDHFTMERVRPNPGVYPIFVIMPDTCGWTSINQVKLAQSLNTSK